MKITYLTGNWAKIKQAKKLFEPLGIEVDNFKMEVPELQADTMEEVAASSSKWASNELKKSVLVNDTGLVIKALKGFPGVYTHYASDTINEKGILKLMEGIEDREAYFSQTLAYCEYGKEPVTFTSITKGHIALEPEGTYGWTWDFIFIPEGKDHTLGVYEDDERFALWNDECYYDLAECLKEKEDSNFVCKLATLEEINDRWDYLINKNPNDNSWIKYKSNSIECFKNKTRLLYYGLLDNKVVCEATAIISVSDKYSQNSEKLIEDKNIAYLTAFRTDKEYEDKGLFGMLYKYMENDLKQKGYKRLTLGVEPCEVRNIQIYFHWGYTNYIKSDFEEFYSENEDEENEKAIVSYYYKDLY